MSWVSNNVKKQIINAMKQLKEDDPKLKSWELKQAYARMQEAVMWLQVYEDEHD